MIDPGLGNKARQQIHFLASMPFVSLAPSFTFPVLYRIQRPYYKPKKYSYVDYSPSNILEQNGQIKKTSYMK